MMLLWIVLLVLAIYAVLVWLRRGDERGADVARGGARAVLDRRYAAGEFDDEAYRRMRDELS